MSKRISFEEIGGVVATFLAEEGVKAGQVVKVTGEGTVGPCQAGDKFCGVAVDVARDGVCSVQVGGFAEMAVSGQVSPGWAVLAADGQGGVTAGSGGAGLERLVVSADGDMAVALL